MDMDAGLTYWTVTECAECLDGLSDRLMGQLWSFHFDDKAFVPGEDSWPELRETGNDLKNHWDKLTPEDQTQLNLSFNNYCT